MIITARVARTGVQEYPTGPERRDASEVFAAESMATWVGAPVIVGHRSIEDAADAEEHAVGYVVAVERDRGDGDGIEFVRARLKIWDESVIARMRDGELGGFSAGYSMTLDGDRQTQIRIEHLAIGPRTGWARCGEACSI